MSERGEKYFARRGNGETRRKAGNELGRISVSSYTGGAADVAKKKVPMSRGDKGKLGWLAVSLAERRS